MPRAVTLFMIMPPVDLNDELVEKAAYLEHQLATEFPGYEFEVVDLNTVTPVGANRKAQFGDGMSFAAIPLLGQTGAAEDGGYMCAPPSPDLVRDIAEACGRFDIENPQKYAA